MHVVAIIVAAGQGKRFGNTVEKQFLLLDNRPLLFYCLDTFERCTLVDEIVLVVPESQLVYCASAIVDEYNLRKVKKIVPGGKERQDSVYNGIQAIDWATEIVVIHDGVRPFVTQKLITQSIELCEEFHAVVVAIPIKDSVKRVTQEFVDATLNRELIWIAQTPQTFTLHLIKSAYTQAYKDRYYGTDDAGLVERLGYRVKILKGDPQNIKITTPEDLMFAEFLLQTKHKK